MSNQLLYYTSIVKDIVITKYVIGIIMIDTLLTSTIRYITRTYWYNYYYIIHNLMLYYYIIRKNIINIPCSVILRLYTSILIRLLIPVLSNYSILITILNNKPVRPAYILVMM